MSCTKYFELHYHIVSYKMLTKSPHFHKREDTNKMALEALSTNELLNLIIYDSFSTTSSYTIYGSSSSSSSDSPLAAAPPPPPRCCQLPAVPEYSDGGGRSGGPVQGRKKRKRRAKVCKNKEEEETQRMTHITVERNRRKQMNEHLGVLRSLMPQSYVQRVIFFFNFSITTIYIILCIHIYIYIS